MIQVDPAKRTTLRAIAAHSWIVDERENAPDAAAAADAVGVPAGLPRVNIRTAAGGHGGGGGVPPASPSRTGGTIAGRINSGLHKISKFMNMSLGGGGGGGGEGGSVGK